MSPMSLRITLFMPLNVLCLCIPLCLLNPFVPSCTVGDNKADARKCAQVRRNVTAQSSTCGGSGTGIFGVSALRISLIISSVARCSTALCTGHFFWGLAVFSYQIHYPVYRTFLLDSSGVFLSHHCPVCRILPSDACRGAAGTACLSVNWPCLFAPKNLSSRDIGCFHQGVSLHSCPA